MLPVPRRHLVPSIRLLRKTLDLRYHESGAKAVDFDVRSNLIVQKVVLRVESMIDQALKSVSVLAVASVDPPTVTCCDLLIRVKRCNGEVTICTCQLIVTSLLFLSASCAHAFTDILDKHDLLLRAEVRDLGDFRRSNAVSVANDNGSNRRIW